MPRLSPDISAERETDLMPEVHVPTHYGPDMPPPNDQSLLATILQGLAELTEKVSRIEAQIPKGLDRKLDLIQQALSKGDVSFALFDQKLNQIDKDMNANTSKLEARVAALEAHSTTCSADRTMIKKDLTDIAARTDPQKPMHWAVQAAITAVITVVATGATVWSLQGIAGHQTATSPTKNGP